MKQLMLSLLIFSIMIFSVITISAFEIDNFKYYDEDKREYLVKNAFGVGEDIAKVKLTSSLNQIVPRGYQQVAEFEVENYDDYVNVFNDMEFYDLNDNNKEFTRNFDYKYKTIIQVPDYKTTCDKGLNENGTISNICRAEQIGFYDKIVWKDINKETGLLKGNITIGIFTDVKKGDKVEWIPTLFGERLTNWAVWTESLNVNLVACYKLDGLSGDVVDSQSNHDGTNVGATRGATGILNFSFDFENDDSDRVNLTDISNFSSIDKFGLSVWVNPEVLQSTDVVIAQATSGQTDAMFLLRLDVTGKIDFILWNQAGGLRQLNNVKGIAKAGEWTHIVVTYDGTRAWLFVNDSLSTTGTLTGNVRNSPQNITLGSFNNLGNFYDGLIDEVFIWNRNITGSEITDLYNNATAITCTKDFFPTVTLNSPVNAFNSSSQTINFNGTVAISGAGIANVTLFIDGVLNETNSSGINDTDYLFEKVIADGNHNWTYETCDLGGGCAIATTRTFTIDTAAPTLNVTEPFGVIPFADISINQTLTWELTEANPDVCLLQYEETNTTLNCATNVSNFTIGTARTLDIFANDTFGNMISDTVTWSYLVLQTSSTNNASSFETAQESFIVNVTTNGSAVTSGILNFDGTENIGAIITNPAGDNFTIQRIIIIPTGVSTKNFNFNLTVQNMIINTTIQSQIINLTNFTICGAAPQDIPFINITFKNETLAEENIDATISSTWIYSLSALSGINKTLSFTDATENLNYTFCATPNRTFNIQIDIDYDNSISQQRSFSSTRTISNITATEILYLLPTALGIFSPFKTTNINGDTISFVLATITRVLNSVTITVGNGLTDSSGFATFFLDPNAAHIATFSKTGFADNVFTFTPSTDLRTVVMGGGGVISNGTIISRGTTYVMSPGDTTLPNNTVITFTFNVTSNLTTITLISMNITNSSNSELLFVSNAGVGNLSGTLNTGNNTKLFGSFIIQTTEETISVTRIWLIFTTFAGDYSIFTQFTLAKDNELITEFMRLLIVLSFMVGVLIFMNMGKVIETSESNIAVLLLLTWAFSIVGWLDTGLVVSTTDTGINRLGEFSNQFGIAIVMTGAAVLFIFRRLFIRKPA